MSFDLISSRQECFVFSALSFSIVGWGSVRAHVSAAGVCEDGDDIADMTKRKEKHVCDVWWKKKRTHARFALVVGKKGMGGMW